MSTCDFLCPKIFTEKHPFKVPTLEKAPGLRQRLNGLVIIMLLNRHMWPTRDWTNSLYLNDGVDEMVQYNKITSNLPFPLRKTKISMIQHVNMLQQKGESNASTKQALSSQGTIRASPQPKSKTTAVHWQKLVVGQHPGLKHVFENAPSKASVEAFPKGNAISCNLLQIITPWVEVFTRSWLDYGKNWSSSSQAACGSWVANSKASWKSDALGTWNLQRKSSASKLFVDDKWLHESIPGPVLEFWTLAFKSASIRVASSIKIMQSMTYILSHLQGCMMLYAPHKPHLPSFANSAPPSGRSSISAPGSFLGNSCSGRLSNFIRPSPS